MSRALSGRSSNRSAKAMKVEAAAKAVEMEVQLKYHSAEQEHKRVQIQKELEIAKARLQVIKETEEDETHPMKLPKAEEDVKHRVESYIQTLPTATTLQQDIKASATAVPVSTAMNIVLVGPSGIVPATGTPTQVVPPTSTAITLPVVTSSVLTSSTSWLTTLPSATVPITSVMAPVSFPTSDITFPSAPSPIFATRLSDVAPDVCSSDFGLNSNASQFVPSSSVTRQPGFVGLPTGFGQQQPYSNASVLAPRDTLEPLGTSQSSGFNPHHFVQGGQHAAPMYATSSFNPAMDSTRVMADLAAQLHVSRIPVPEPLCFLVIHLIMLHGRVRSRP